MSLPNELYHLTNDVPVTSDQLFGDDINTSINNIKAQQKAFKVNKTYFNPERTYFPIHNSKTWERFPKIPRNQKRGAKINVQNRHTRKQGTS